MRLINLFSVDSWQKLTEKQLLDIAEIMSQPQYDRSLVTKVFLKLNGLRIKKGFVLTKTDDGHAYKSYIFQKNGYRKFTIGVNIFTTMVRKFDWLADEITLFRCVEKIGRFKASDHRLYGVTLEQFLFADNLYNAFVSTRQLNYLRKLVAVFYHPEKEKFDTSKVARRSRRFLFTRRNRLFATYLWYTGAKRWIMNKYPYVFSGGESGDEVPADESIMNMLSALNQGDITKNETILKTHVHEALFQLNLMAQNVENHV
jgi:hypothetical protein